MSRSHLCSIIEREGTNSSNLSLAIHYPDESLSDAVNEITYSYIAPSVIAIGIVGDVLTVYTLTHPLLRKSSIIYTYLTLLALTDLLTQLSVIPMLLWMLEMNVCSFATSFFYAHIGFPLANAFMGASVWIVVFLTLSQYMAVCRPFTYGLRSRKVCYSLVGIAYIFNLCIYAPWALKKQVFELPISPGSNTCPYIECERKMGETFTAYEVIRELISRVFPFFLVAFLNARILITYRSTKIDRIQRLSQRGCSSEKSEKEEKRLFILLFAIIIIFFVCTIPAAPLPILVKQENQHDVGFQIFRAITNMLEFTKFALNFYLYCLINPDIRNICIHVIMCRKLHRPARVKGQPVTPLSMYTKSTKSRDAGNGSSRRSSREDKNKANNNSKQQFPIANDVIVEKLTVIKEADTDDIGDRL